MQLVKLPMTVLSFLFSTLLFSQSWALYTPQEALKDLMSEDLKYIGSFIPSYSVSGKIPACVFKNSKVYVKYQYCVSYAVPAGQVTIHSADPAKGYVKIYAEGPGDQDVSDMVQSDYYEVFWYAASAANDPNFDMSMSLGAYKKYDNITAQNNTFTGCVTAGTLTNYSNNTYCYAGQSGTDAWTGEAYSFWKSPGDQWYNVLKIMKNKVPKSDESVDGSDSGNK